VKEARAFQQMVTERGRRLRTLTYQQLAAMESEPDEMVAVGDRKGTISLMVERDGAEQLKVVVQGFLRSRWVAAIKDVALDGFHKHRDGVITGMTDAEFREYD